MHLTIFGFLPNICRMPKKRALWKPSDVDYHDIEKYFEFYDLSLRRYYTDFVDNLLRAKNIEGKILDIGCGFAILGMMICARDEFSSVWALEQSRTLVKASEVISLRRGYGKRITFKVWEDDLLPYPDGEFDAVVSFLSLHKWINPERTMAEIQRVRKKDGMVYISDFRRDQPAIPFKLFVQQTRFEMGKEIADELKKSYHAAYNADEIRQLLNKINSSDLRLEEDKIWLNIISGLSLSENAPENKDTVEPSESDSKSA